jgi:hypothetical protein
MPGGRPKQGAEALKKHKRKEMSEEEKRVREEKK